MGRTRLGDVNWLNLLFIVSYHSLLFVLLPFYFIYFGAPSTGIIVSAVVMFLLTGPAITAGYHRLFSHKSYKANSFVESIILFFGTLATANDVVSWSYDHRIHHAKTDTEEDPYSIKKGFLHAHVLWLFKKSPPRDLSKVPDLVNNPRAMFQRKYYLWIYLIGSVVTTVVPGLLFNDMLGAFVFVYLLRLFVTHHIMWSTNSFAHTWGSKDYNKNISAVDNPLVGFFTLGEGYHNYHHAYPSDYRNGVKWYHFDLSKWIIYSMSKVGLAKNLIRQT